MKFLRNSAHHCRRLLGDPWHRRGANRSKIKSKSLLATMVVMLLVLWGIPGMAQNSGVNLLENAGFEVKGENGLPQGWQIVPNSAGRGEVSMDEQSVHSGKYSLGLKPNRKNTAEGFGVATMLDPAKLRGKTVTVSGFAKFDPAYASEIAGVLLKTDKENWLVIPKVPESKFVPFSKSFVIGDSMPNAALLLFVGGTSGAVWFDDLSITVNQVSAESLTVSAPQPSGGELVRKINTPGWVDSPFISPDGQELYFAYVPYTEKDLLNIAYGKISEKEVTSKGPIRPGSHGTLNFETYRATRNKDGSWGPPVNLNINGTYSAYSAKLSSDGQELYYALRDYPGNIGGSDIYVSKKLPDGNWGPPVSLGPNINSKYNDDHPYLSTDGKTLYFSRNVGDALGWEIMKSVKVAGEWTKAVKLGPPINEPNPEKNANHQPIVTADGKELYFSRIMHLYKSERQPDGSWGKPVRVFDRQAGHASVTADGRFLYFLSTRDAESLQRHQWSIWVAERQADGSWGKPRPVD